MTVNLWPVLLLMLEGGRAPDKAQRDVLYAAIVASVRYDGTYPRDRAAQWQMWRNP